MLASCEAMFVVSFTGAGGAALPGAVLVLAGWLTDSVGAALAEATSWVVALLVGSLIRALLLLLTWLVAVVTGSITGFGEGAWPGSQTCGQ